jgi:hypothetical protein
MNDPQTFKLSVLGRYEARLKDNAPHVTVNLLAGQDDHLVYCGTLTMSEPEWDAFVSALRQSLGDRVEVEEGTPTLA